MAMNKDVGDVVVSYSPKILRSMAEICEIFGVAKETVRAWKEMGAPILVMGRGKGRRYSTEVMRLQAWREKLSSEN